MSQQNTVPPQPRIKGTFIKQIWNGKYTETVEKVGFDATDSVLLLTLESIRKLEDCRDSADQIGTDNVDWNGPFEVTVVDSILDFFSVDALSDITEEMLSDARTRYNPQPLRTVTAVLQVTLKMECRGDTVDAAISELDYTFSSTLPGHIVKGFEITDVEIK